MLFVIKKAVSYGIDYIVVMFFVAIFTFCAEVFYQGFIYRFGKRIINNKE